MKASGSSGYTWINLLSILLLSALKRGEGKDSSKWIVVAEAGLFELGSKTWVRLKVRLVKPIG